MLKIAVCDDDADILHKLAARIEAAFSDRSMTVTVHPFAGAGQLQPVLDAFRFDVFFLDIDMPDMDGVALGALLRKRSNDICIVFISSREDRVYDSLKVAPLRFIRKTRFDEEIGETVDAIMDWDSKKQNRFFVVPSHGHLAAIQIDDIVFAECQGKKLKIITTTQDIFFKGTMCELESKLLEHGFLRPHHGFLVNYKYIDTIASASINLKNGVSIPLSRHRAKEVKQMFLRLVSKESEVLTASVC